MNQQNPIPPISRPRLTWRQFSLRTLLVAMAIISAAGAWVSAHLRWKKERAAARAHELNIETMYGLVEDVWTGTHAPPPAPPKVLQWFGETQGTAVVLVVDPDQPELSQADRARLARLFPEAKVSVLGEPDCPLDLVGFAAFHWDHEERNQQSQQRFEAARLERRAIAQRRRQALADLGKSEPSTAAAHADSLGQLLRIERRLEATQLELAATAAERSQVLDARSQQLQVRELAYERLGQEPAARYRVLACRAEQSRLAESRAWLDQPAGRLEWDDTEISIQYYSWIGQLQWLQKIAALYMVGAKGGEKELAARQGLRVAAGGARLAEIKADRGLAGAQWFLACQFADMAAAAYAELMADGKYLEWLNVSEYCQLLSDRTDVKFARRAYLKRMGILTR